MPRLVWLPVVLSFVLVKHIQCLFLGKSLKVSGSFLVYLVPILNTRYFIEPVGSVGPRLTSGDKTRNVDIALTGSGTLLCPAQAYPVPFFR